MADRSSEQADFCEPAGLRVQDVESDGRGWTVRIASPAYDPARPGREVTGGCFNGSAGHGLIVRASDPEDLHTVGTFLVAVAERIRRGEIR